ncbi:MAG TPA: signal peptidase II [Actinomycetota bacterium]|nr:signal peptidase II [Actinomycetota bacterium]
MDAGRGRAARTLFVAALAAYGLDRLTKVWAEAVLPGDPIELIPGALTLRFTENSGGAFSIGQSAPWFFVGVSAIVSLVIVVTAFRHSDRIVATGLGLVLGGALGNLTDRAIRAPDFGGHVIDFVDLHLWPVFNVADSAVVIGALLVAWRGIRDGRERPGDEPVAPSGPAPAERARPDAG